MNLFLSILLSLMLFGVNSQDLRKVVDLRGPWKFAIGDNPRWMNPAFDDSQWVSIAVPSKWEDQGFSGFDGYAWYRITVELSHVDSNNLYLVLGYIDDVDEVYLNGELIGFNGSFPPDFYTAFQSHRQYYLPPELWNKNGRNVIAVRVFDTILEGGIVKGDIGIYTKKDAPAKVYLLEGIWKFKEGDNQWWKGKNYNDDKWDRIMVPGYWRSLKHKEIIEGTAWYRKEFIMPNSFRNDHDLVLIIGKIDDFDETYLNEKLIGTTNDGAIFGLSGSWDKYRVYSIPKDILNYEGKNTLAVRVRDLGGNAGIYTGPLAIVPASEIKRLIPK